MLAVICICEIIEFFIVYDFMFYQTIQWARHNQWLAFYVEYTRMLQTTVILSMGIIILLLLPDSDIFDNSFQSLGVHQSLTIAYCCSDCG